MAWTAAVTGKRLVESKGRLRALFDVTFTDGPESVTEALEASSLEQLRVLVGARLTALAANAAAVAAVSSGAITPPAVTPPTQVDLDRQDFLKKWRTLQRVQIAVDAGLVPANDARVTSYRTAVQTAFNKVVTNEGATAALELL